jgi:hypothetical protein
MHLFFQIIVRVKILQLFISNINTGIIVLCGDLEYQNDS